MSNILPFDDRFDATDLTIEQIRMAVRHRGWSGMQIDGDQWFRTGRLIVYRLSSAYLDRMDRLTRHGSGLCRSVS